MASEGYSEKVSVNINSSTLSEIDLLVDHGYYSNRSDFINQALREALKAQQPTLKRIMDQYRSPAPHREKQWFLGVVKLFPRDIEEWLASGENTSLTGYGVLVLDDQIEPEKLYAAVSKIHVRGRVTASPEIKAHYGLK